MKKTIFTAVLIGLMLVSAGSVFAAGNGNGSCDRDRLRDGSCQVASNGSCDRDRLRDGSCQVASNGSCDRDQLRDGSCQTA